MGTYPLLRPSHRPHQRHHEAGFGFGSLLAALALALLIFQGFEPTMAYFRATPRVNAAAAHLETITKAAANYVKDHQAELTTTLPLNGAATSLATTALRDEGYLGDQIADTNDYGQQYSLRIRYLTQGSGTNAKNVLNALLVTEGGHAIPDRELLRIAAKLPVGGSIRSDDPAQATGNGGSWRVPMLTFGGTPGTGHLAAALFAENAATLADYLYRSAVPGQPELNRMNTAIDMNDQNLANANTVQNKQTEITAANGQSIWIDNDSGTLRWLNDDKSQSLATLDPTGNLNATGNVTGKRLTSKEYVQIDGEAVENTACSPNGLVARTHDGLLLSCNGGIWRKPESVWSRAAATCPYGTVYTGDACRAISSFASSGGDPRAYWASCTTTDGYYFPPGYRCFRTDSGGWAYLCCPA